MRSLESYTYPLNISELKTMVERAATQVGVRVYVCVCARMCTCEGVRGCVGVSVCLPRQRCSIGAGQQLGGERVHCVRDIIPSRGPRFHAAPCRPQTLAAS